MKKLRKRKSKSRGKESNERKVPKGGQKYKYKGQTIEREYKNRIDVYLEDGSAEGLYEIKPFESP